jgi:hypothetical protein
MLDGVDVRTVLKRGALVAAANWQVTVIQFMAESTFKMLLSVPVAGGVLLVVLVLGRELPELFSPDIRESITFVATALAAEPPALISFLLAFAIVALAGSAFMFLLKGGTVAVLAGAEREAAAVEEPPLRLDPFWTAARFSVSRYESGCRRFVRRFLRLGLILILVYVASAAAYLAVLLRGADWFAGSRLGWAAIAGIGSTVLVVWVTLVNFVYLLIQMVVVVEDCSVRSATRRVWKFLRAEPRLTFGVLGVLLLLVAGATIVSVIATTSLGLSALSAYLTLYRRYSGAPAAPGSTPAAGLFGSLDSSGGDVRRRGPAEGSRISPGG